MLAQNMGPMGTTLVIVKDKIWVKQEERYLLC